MDVLDELDEKIQKKSSYLKRLRALFRQSPKRPGIPKAFRKIDLANIHWFTRPQSMLSVFQKILLSIKSTRMRLDVLNNLVRLTDKTDKPYIEGDRMRLQDQIFRAITGTHFAYPITTRMVSHDDIQNRDFFRLIGMGLHVYENIDSNLRDQFNKAVMPNVKKQNIVVPYRLQQYNKSK